MKSWRARLTTSGRVPDQFSNNRLGNSVPPEVRQSFPIINVGVRLGDIGVGAGNLGLALTK